MADGVQPFPNLPTPPHSALLPFANMIPAVSLDLFILTFNCAKTTIDVDVFARHLRAALLDHGNKRTEEATEVAKLPHLVVFSLQEISPLAHAFVGGYLLKPYLLAFRDALNLAALEIEDQHDDAKSGTPRSHEQRSKSTISSLWRRQSDYPYKLIEARNVGMTAIMLFARKPDAIHHIQSADCAFGIANMGNKGAVALRVQYSDVGEAVDEQSEQAGQASSSSRTVETQRTTEITFVATHLAAMEYNLRRRNTNWASIVSSCTFENPKAILPAEYYKPEAGAKHLIEASTTSCSSTSSATRAEGKQTDGGQDIPHPTEDEHASLLAREQTASSIPADHASRLHKASIFKPGSHLLVAGDLNYRISTSTPPPLAPFPTMDNFMEFLERDQLTQERCEGRTLHGLSEAEMKFPPTYKIKHLSTDKAADAVNSSELQSGQDDVVPWKWASHRWPGWCDRILYLDIPSWVKRQHANKVPVEMVVHKYNSMPTMLSSDHQAVYLRISVPLLTPEELMAPEDEVTVDPRVRLPVPIDMGAWERRATARKREFLTGIMTMFFFTREGAVVLGTVAMVSFITWSLYQRFL